MPLKQERKFGAVSDIKRVVRPAVFSSPTVHKNLDGIVQELRGAITDPPPPIVVEPTSQPAYDERIVPVHPLDAWASASRPSKPEVASRQFFRSFISLAPWLVGASLVIGGLLYVSQYGLQLKSRVVQQGNAAISNLLSAKQDLKNFDINAAQSDFSQAEEKFTAATSDMETLGPGLLNLASKIPGLGSLAAGHDLARAGELISNSGQAITKALSAVSQAGGLLDPKATDQLALGQVFVPLRQALEQADRNMTEAAGIVAGISEDSLPDKVRAQFIQFKDKMPELLALVHNGNDALTFISSLTGMEQPRRYLLLFQNSSEMRPTGGFPGSYGLITFEGGRIKDLKTDDIYNPDGQIKDLVIPPRQLQGITPSWGMRDAAWFIDFPTSARKVAEFYRRGGGSAVDGVIAIRPDIVTAILRITGPVSLPVYDTVLTADNFLPTVQQEVESQKTPEPKRIIMDLAPILLQRIASLPASEWLKVVQVINTGLTDHDVMMSFQDDSLQKYAFAQGWDGSVKQTDSDFLMVDVSNIKGAKADAVTDNSVKIETILDGGTLVHRLTFTRQHNGGSTPFAFYNHTNYSYVRVLVPDGSTLRGINGNDHPANRPMMSYASAKAETDADLAALEATYHYDASLDVTTYKESGKTGFGFWMKVEPGKTQAVQLEYVIPARYSASDYQLYVQRQSGLDMSNFEFTLQKSGGLNVTSSQPALTAWPDSWRYQTRPEGDLEISAQLSK